VQNAHRPEPLLAQLGNRAFSVGWISTRLAAASCLCDLTVPWSRSLWVSHHSDMPTGTSVLCVLRPLGGTPVSMVQSEVLQEQQIEILIVRYIVVFGPFL